MSKLKITDYAIYRWRYWIGYGLIAAILISVLTFTGFFLTGGISEPEMQSVVISNSINFSNLNSLAITDLPYHTLQHISIMLFGVSVFSIKLPSLILAFISIIGAIILLRIWFKPSVSVLVALIAISTGQFLFMSQDGTANGMCLVWSVSLLLIASIISRTRRFRKSLIVIFAILAVLSLYTPLSAYMLIAFACAILFHPHLRYLVKQIPNVEIVAGTILSLILITPLAISIIKNPSLGLSLLGIPTKIPDLSANIALLGAQYLGFSKPGGSTVMTPFFELGSMLIIALGVYVVAKHHTSAKSYVIAIWSLMLVPIVIVNPNLAVVTLFPMVLLLAKGLNKFISYWYELFPLNPYARVGGLIPIIILVSVLVLSGMDRYIYGYRYDPQIVPSFSRDIRIIPKDTKYLMVSSDEMAFYKVVEIRNKKITVVTTPTGDSFLATRKIKGQFSGYNLSKIITTYTKDNGDRFYLYTKAVQ